MSPERALGKSIDNNVEKIQGNDNIFDYFVKEAEIFGYKIFSEDMILVDFKHRTAYNILS